MWRWQLRNSNKTVFKAPLPRHGEFRATWPSRRGRGGLLEFLISSVFLLAIVATVCAEPIPVGVSRFTFIDQRGNAERPITAWTYRPDAFRLDGQILFIMHGRNRNGETYRDSWVELARQGRMLLIAPEFSFEHYPSETMYQLGYLTEPDGTFRDREKTAFAAIEHLFDHVVQENAISTKGYYLYGHSAGGQFVHRFVLSYPEGRYKLAIAANPGWYTTVDLQTQIPYGLKGSPVNSEKLAQSLARPLVVLLGEEDTDPNHRWLPRTPAAMRQGAHRFERGNRFFKQAKSYASEHHLPFAWKLATVPGADHNNAKMAPAAAKLFREAARKDGREVAPVSTR